MTKHKLKQWCHVLWKAFVTWQEDYLCKGVSQSVVIWSKQCRDSLNLSTPKYPKFKDDSKHDAQNDTKAFKEAKESHCDLAKYMNPAEHLPSISPREEEQHEPMLVKSFWKESSVKNGATSHLCRTGIIRAQEDGINIKLSDEWVIVAIVRFPLGKHACFLQLGAGKSELQLVFTPASHSSLPIQPGSCGLLPVSLFNEMFFKLMYSRCYNNKSNAAEDK